MKRHLGYSLAILLLALFCFLFVDRELAVIFSKTPLFVRDVFEFITQAGDSKYSLVASFLLFLYFRIKQNRLRESQALFVWFSVAISGIVADIIKFIVGRSRPRLFLEQNIYDFDFFKAAHIWNSFPSGHSATALSLAMSLIIFLPKYRIPLFAIGCLIAFSRVVITAHYLSDVLVGGLIGVLSVFVLEKYFANHKCYNIYQNGCKL